MWGGAGRGWSWTRRRGDGHGRGYGVLMEHCPRILNVQDPSWRWPWPRGAVPACGGRLAVLVLPYPAPAMPPSARRSIRSSCCRAWGCTTTTKTRRLAARKGGGEWGGPWQRPTWGWTPRPLTPRGPWGLSLTIWVGACCTSSIRLPTRRRGGRVQARGRRAVIWTSGGARGAAWRRGGRGRRGRGWGRGRRRAGATCGGREAR